MKEYESARDAGGDRYSHQLSKWEIQNPLLSRTIPDVQKMSTRFSLVQQVFNAFERLLLALHLSILRHAKVDLLVVREVKNIVIIKKGAWAPLFVCPD